MIALSGVPADIEFVGLRPGEKLHEELVSETETLLPSGARRSCASTGCRSPSRHSTATSARSSRVPPQATPRSFTPL